MLSFGLRLFDGLRMPAVAAAEEAVAQAPEKKAIEISDAQMTSNGVTVATAGPGKLVNRVKLPGEVRLNADRVARIVPKIAGVISDVRKKLGDAVKAGETVAVLESKDLALATSAWLAAQDRLGLAKTTFEREKVLWEKKISAEQDYLAAKQAFASAGIDLRSAEQQLRALGMGNDDLKRLSGRPAASYTRFEIASPMDGSVIEKHVVLGEALLPDANIFIVADLTTLWIDFSVGPKDIASVHIGQHVRIVSDDNDPGIENELAYIGPTVEQDSRSAMARAILSDYHGGLKPGMFVTGLAETSAVDVPLLIPKTALQTVAGVPTVFVREGEGFAPSTVKCGRENDTDIEIVSGLKPGQQYAATGTFVFKAELEKGKAGEE